jgi:hypothetical protein
MSAIVQSPCAAVNGTTQRITPQRMVDKQRIGDKKWLMAQVVLDYQAFPKFALALDEGEAE